MPMPSMAGRGKGYCRPREGFGRAGSLPSVRPHGEWRRVILMCSHAARLPFTYPWGAAGHAPTFVRATAAGLGACLTMLHLEFCTLIAARFAQFCASLADRTGKLATARHIARSHAANLGAVHIQRNAARHCLRIRFLQTGGCAMVAGICAGIAGFNAGGKLFMGHDYSNQELMRNSPTAAAVPTAAGRTNQFSL